MYNKIAFPATDISTKNEIPICKHLLRKKDTFPVCDICGVAKCEVDITINDGRYFCKDQLPEEVEEQKESFGSKIRKFKIRK